jgi:hypothetical protein
MRRQEGAVPLKLPLKALGFQKSSPFEIHGH